jgi:catechol 2,3-dioxygenase-like lactoylglutathione lyase family enzyme
MITGAHVLIYSGSDERDRAFFRDVLGFASVDAGHGWLIFALPPAELAVHPAEGDEHHELYLMCDSLDATMNELKAKGAEFALQVKEERWGRVTALKLPSGALLGIYEPRHPTAIRK